MPAHGSPLHLRALPGGTRPQHVAVLLAAVRDVLDGAAQALVPHAPEEDRDEVLATLRLRLARAVPAGTAAVLQTSGSTTGTGHLVALSAAALTASARATEERLAGPGQWLLAVPAHHVAGLQVLVRSVVAGTEPVLLDTSDGFDAHRLAGAAEAMRDDVPGYLSLVPTQLVRVLEAGPDAVAPLRRLAAILVGGAALPPQALTRARDAGLRVVTTYGMTETGGGCVYDGAPLPGVRLRVAGGHGRIEIAGPMLATGYLDDLAADSATFVAEDGVRWLRTSDRGVLAPLPAPDDGPADDAGGGPRPGDASPARLQVLGRVDDVINTGGVKVSPAAVERLLGALPGVAEVAVVGVPDDEWGQLVTAVVVPSATAPAPDLETLRELVRDALGGAHAPRAVVTAPALPQRGPGKIDRIALTREAEAALADGRRGGTQRLG
ncbi:AMP-binding protein [Georgenia subflava]|uniref:AMP-binding protein n=1 Tax=Georgenia subflava TaxID=1622177 RepID=A0A6N7EJ83_9MICO|nr:AMP-binding protein [Georgenia subflava]